MAELNPPLGTTTPEIFLDNVKRADELVNGPAGTVNDHAGEPLDTWRQMMAKNDEVRQNIIPLSKQYQTLEAAQADIANIPVGSTTYYRSPDDSALAIEVMNVGGTLQPTGRKMPSQQAVDQIRQQINYDAVQILKAPMTKMAMFIFFSMSLVSFLLRTSVRFQFRKSSESWMR
ncbi:flagellar biosynthesis, cell-distal portion of basal-body rod [Klebsiella pneumoniae]|nr:flagellar biosynthesis, cell-distal portion of basal-body rod [Klebsiella pneumoniae]